MKERIRNVVVGCIVAMICFCTAVPVYASINWGERVQITQERQVVDSITFNGVTVNAYYGLRSQYASEVDYWMAGYSCSEFKQRFYLSVYGDRFFEEYTFVQTNSPVIGDWALKNDRTHDAIVKQVNGSNVTLIEQNLFADRTNNVALRGRTLVNDGNATFTYYHPVKKANQEKVEAFVTRLYKECFGREPDTAGFYNWVSKLVYREISAAQAIQGFLFSTEMKNKNLSNEDFVEVCYRVLFDRNSDAAGKSGWVSKLNQYASRNAVVKGFVDSVEFTRLCNQYDLTKGTINALDQDENYGVTAFVARLYTKAFGRNYDANGLNYWCKQINTKKQSPKTVSTNGFFNSKEFLNKQLNDAEFVKVLYRTFLDREFEQAGLEYWVVQLANGKTRNAVIAGFADSVEFTNLMKKYGLY